MANIPENAIEFNGHHYNIYQGGTCHSWDDAVKYCESLGGHMAVINNKEENTFLHQFLQDSNVSNAYFGLTDIGHEGEWTWVNGDLSTYRNWDTGEPNNAGGEHYAMFFNGTTSPGSWNDGQFGELYGDSDRTFICEWDGESSTSNNSNQYDIVFILDKSTSMDRYINSVKDNIATFVDTLRTEGIDVQLGLVEYEKISNTIKYDLTSDIDTFISNVNSITTTGGDEYGLTAITDATIGALSLDFREGANKEFIVVTDEGFEENNDSSTMSDYVSASEVIAKLQDNNVKLDVFGKMGSGVIWSYGTYTENSCQDEWTPIANSTTGQLINGETVQGQFYDITEDFSTLFRAAIIDGDPTSVSNGTHQLSLTQWKYGFTPSDATASLSSDATSSYMINPNT